MPRPVFNVERCKGCELCTTVCPKHILVIGKNFNTKGYRPAQCTDESQCIGCAMCARMCPDVVIEIHK